MSEVMASLDHYNGRAVEDVNKRSGEWQIILEGNVRIVNYDEDYEMPDKEMMTMLKLQSVSLSSSDTTLHFGTDDNPRSTVVHLSPMKYGIADSERFEGVIKPQVGGVEREPYAELPEEDAERLQEGPESQDGGEPTPEEEEATGEE